MRREITVYELQDYDGGDGTRNSASGMVTTSREVADGWCKSGTGKSTREVRGILIHSLEEVEDVRLDLKRAAALRKLTASERELLGLVDAETSPKELTGKQLLAKAQAEAFKRCADIIQSLDPEGERAEGYASIAHLRRMCAAGAALAGTWPADKTGRWLGYVQGCLTAMGHFDVDAERNRTRSTFKDAYAIMGLTVPETLDLASSETPDQELASESLSC